MSLWLLRIPLVLLLPVVWYCAYVDFRTHKIPNRVTYPALLFFGGFQLLVQPDKGSVLIGLIAGFLFFFIPALFFGVNAIGVGDAKLGAVIGCVLGWPGILLVLVASQLIALLFILPMLLTRRLSLKSKLPLGPFLALGYTLTLLWVFLLTRH